MSGSLAVCVLFIIQCCCFGCLCIDADLMFQVCLLAFFFRKQQLNIFLHLTGQIFFPLAFCFKLAIVNGYNINWPLLVYVVYVLVFSESA